MKKADLLAALALVGFHEIEDYMGADMKGNYKYARWALHTRIWRNGTAPILLASIPKHLMVDIYYSVIAEAFYSCSIEGCENFKTRNPEKVWKWLQEQLYLQQENRGLRP